MHRTVVYAGLCTISRTAPNHRENKQIGPARSYVVRRSTAAITGLSRSKLAQTLDPLSLRRLSAILNWLHDRVGDTVPRATGPFTNAVKIFDNLLKKWSVHHEEMRNVGTVLSTCMLDPFQVTTSRAVCETPCIWQREIKVLFKIEIRNNDST